MAHDSALTTMNISLPRAQREFVEAAARESGCTTTSEFVRRLIHEAQRRMTQEELERKLLEGLESGQAIEVTPAYLESKRARLRARHRAELE
jgi:antitoxin ParD1/3/4